MGTLSLQSDQVLPQGYLKIDGVTAATLTTAGISGVLYKPATATNGQVLTYNGSTWVAGNAPQTNNSGTFTMTNLVSSVNAKLATVVPSVASYTLPPTIGYYFSPGSYMWVCPPDVTEVVIVMGSAGGGTGWYGQSGGSTSCSIGDITVTATGGVGGNRNRGGAGGTVAAVPPDTSKGFSGVSLGAGGAGGVWFGDPSGGMGGAGGSSYGGASRAVPLGGWAGPSPGITGTSIGGSRGGGGGAGTHGGTLAHGGTTDGSGGSPVSGDPRVLGSASARLPSVFTFGGGYRGHARGASGGSDAGGGGAGAIACYAINTIPGTSYALRVGEAGINAGSGLPAANALKQENGYLYVFCTF